MQPAKADRVARRSNAEKETRQNGQLGHGNCDHPSPRCQVAKRAADCLQSSPYTNVRCVSCVYDQGMLMLRGRVPSFYQKQLAQEAVNKLEGVGQVVNEIEVVGPSC
jgi:osmotically-inducible protein OsmY